MEHFLSNEVLKHLFLQDLRQKYFPDVIFLSYEQTKHKDFAKLLNVEYWATIIVYKNSKEVAKEIGITSKSDIYSLIKKEI